MKNRKLLAYCQILVLLSLLILSTTAFEVNAITEKPVIVCTTSAIGSIVEQLVGDTTDVLVLVHPGLCPADFDLKPGYVDAVSKAQILFKQNIQGEFWLEDLLAAAGQPDLIVVAISGIYNTPEGAKNYIKGVAGNLSEIMGVDLDLKVSQMLSEVDEVSKFMESQAGVLDAPNVNVICMSWLQTFIESVGFNVVATYNPPETLSAGDINNLLETAKRENVELVVDNLQIDTDFGASIANQAGAEHVVLTNFPGAIPKTETLAEMLQYNSEQLFNGTILWRSTSTLRTERTDLQNQLTVFQIIASLAIIVALAEAVLLYSKKQTVTAKNEQQRVL